jgi:hypothetical protein
MAWDQDTESSSVEQSIAAVSPECQNSAWSDDRSSLHHIPKLSTQTWHTNLTSRGGPYLIPTRKIMGHIVFLSTTRQGRKLLRDLNAMKRQSNEGCLSQDGQDMEQHAGTWSLTNNTSMAMDGACCSTRGRPLERERWDRA